MGYGFYFVSDGEPDYGTRPGGYMVLATCDKRGCENEIDRGMGYLCGNAPHDLFSDEPGCGRYFCGEHLSWVGDRGGCSHRRNKHAWGKTLSCMERRYDDKYGVTTYCTSRVGHSQPHWDDDE